jgi:iron complex outermembrane receptor protein
MSPQETGAPLPLRVEIDGSRGFKSETVIAYELGYRTQPLERLTVDVSLFFNQYDRLRVRQEGTPVPENATNLVLNYPLTNNMHGHTYGAELSTTWTPLDWWRLQATYSYLRSIMYLDNGSTDNVNRSNAADGSPRNQGSLRSGFDLGSQVEFDLWLRAVDRVKSIDTITIPGYLTMDTKLAWKPIKNLEVALVGQNLFRNRHPEYIPEFINTTASEMPRSVYGKLTWKF